MLISFLPTGKPLRGSTQRLLRLCCLHVSSCLQDMLVSSPSCRTEKPPTQISARIPPLPPQDMLISFLPHGEATYFHPPKLAYLIRTGAWVQFWCWLDIHPAVLWSWRWRCCCISHRY